MLGEVEPLDLFFPAHPESHYPVDDFQNDKGEDNRINDGGAGAYRLNDKLVRVAEKKTVGAARIYGRRGEKAGSQRPPQPPDSMHADHIQGIIISQPALGQHGRIAEGSGNETDEDRRHRPDKTCRRGDRHQTG